MLNCRLAYGAILVTTDMLQKRNSELTLLNRAGQAFVTTLDLDQVLSTILEEVRNLLGVVACSVWLVDRETDELVCQQITDPKSEVVRGWRLAPGQGLAGWVVQNGRSLNVPDVSQEKRHFKGVDHKTGLPLRSILSVPLWVKQRPIGVIQVVDSTVNRFDSTDMRLLEALAATAAVAIENAELYEQTRLDAETKAALLHEVNHRVKNNLAAIIGILYMEKSHAQLRKQKLDYLAVLQDLINRIQGLATVHKMLSAAQWSPLPISSLATQVIESTLQALPPDKRLGFEVSPSPVEVTPKQAHHLAVVINELATNTIKYALRERQAGRMKVAIEQADGLVMLEIRDDGPGYPPEVLSMEYFNVGCDLVQTIVQKGLGGELALFNDGGAVAQIRFRVNGEPDSIAYNDRTRRPES